MSPDDIVTLKEYIEQRWREHEKEHISQEKNMDRRLEEMNRLRHQIESERGTFVLLKEFNLYREALGTTIGLYKDRIQSLEDRFYVIILIASIFGGIIGHYLSKIIP